MQTLSGANTFTGALTINSGTLRTVGGNAIADTVAVTLANTAGAILDLNNAAETIGSLTGGGAAGGNVTLGTARLTTGGDNTSTTYGGVISGTGGLTKLGTGTMTMTGNNSYTAATTLTTGTLMVNGTQAGSAVTMAAGTILSGTGSAGAITNNGGTIQPGLAAATGILTATSANLSVAGAPKLTIQVNGFTAPGTTYDRLTTIGALNLGGTSTLNLDLAGLATSGTATGIITYGSRTNTFTTVNLLNNAGGYSYSLQYLANSIDLILEHPAIIARETEDADHDGHLDRIKMVAESNLNGNFTGLNVTVAGYTVTGYTTGATANVFYVNLTELSGYDTGAQPLVQITANPNLRTAVTSVLIPVDGAGVAPTDKAQPVLVSAKWKDGGTVGMVDAGDIVALTFSEAVNTTGMVFGDLGLPVTGDTLGGTAATAIPDQNAATISFPLPATPQLNPNGAYLATSLGAGMPSGVFLAAATHVADPAGNAAWTGNAASATDLGGSTPNLKLVVNITMQIDANIRIEWTNGTNVIAARTWSNLAADVNTVYVSTGVVANGIDSANSLYFTNRSNLRVDVSAGVTAQGAVWTHDLISNHANDVYHVLAATTGGTPVPSTVDASGAVTQNDFTLDLPQPGTVAVGSIMNKNVSQALDLEYITPLDVTVLGPNTTTVTLTAVAH
jgi:autotransporter-associated beta strand protein